MHASADGEADALHFAPSTVDPLNSSDQTRFHVGAGAGVLEVVVGRAEVRDGVGVARIVVVVVVVVGVATGDGVVMPTVRVAVGE
jgi:hypothetical protein